MRSKSTNPNKRNRISLTKSTEIKTNNSIKKFQRRGTTLMNFMDINNKNFYINKNKNLLLDYDRYLQVKREKENGVVFSALKKISLEEKKKNETFNLYNKFPFNDDPRLIMTNYNLQNNTVKEKAVTKNRILGVDEGYIKLPKLVKENNYIDFLIGQKAFERNLFNVSKEDGDDKNENDKMLTTGNENVLNRKGKIKKKPNKNQMLLERGQEFFSYFAILENGYKTKIEKNKDKLKSLKEFQQYKSIEKKKESYENNLLYNYEIKCLDNWDFEHITKTNDLKNDNKFKKFLNEVDNSQMKWIIEIKNDKEQLRLMRRNKHLYNFLTQIDREQQAMIMQNMNLYQKGFNFDIFNEGEQKEKNKENNCKTENNISNDIINENDVSNSNVSQVEFYRQVIKEKKKLEEMFHNEVRAVAEQCYITNINKKKSVVMAFDIIQELKALASKEEYYRQEYNKKLESLQKRKRKDKKKKIIIENKISNNKSSVISAKNNNFLSPYKDIQTELTKKTSEDITLSEKMTAKSINFQKQSLYLAEKNEIENDYNEKITICNNQKTKLLEKHKKMNNEIKYWDAINKKEKSKLEQRIKALSTYYYQILKKGIDVRNSGLTWVIVKLLELGAFVDKPHFPSFLNDEQILYLMKIGTKTYELSEYIKLFQILKKKQKTLREKHINDNIKKEKMNQIQKYKNNKKKKKDKNFMIGDDYMIYIEEIQRKYENVINICLNENREESNIAKISNDLKQYILNNKEEEEEEQKNNKNRSSKKLELLFIPGSLSEYFAQDKRFRQYFDDVFYLNDEINKRRDNLNKEKQDYLNQYKNNILRGALFGNTDIGDKYKSKKSKENEVVYAALFGKGISI